MKHLTYKQKNQILLLATLFFLLVAYQLAISETLHLQAVNRKLNANIVNAASAPQRIQSFEKKLQDINSTLGYFTNEGDKNQEIILEKVSGFCQRRNITLKEFPQASFTDGPSYALETNAIVVEGDFINLLKLVYELEQNTQIGRVASVKFLSSEDNKRKKTILSLTLYLQNIKLKSPHAI